VLTNLLVPDALLRILLPQVIIKTRNRVLLVIPMVLIDLSCFLVVEVLRP